MSDRKTSKNDEKSEKEEGSSDSSGVDGCHIEVRPSKEDATDYYNYKGWYSVVLFALVDAKYRFTYINVGNAGRCNDSSIFENSALKRELEKCSLLRDLSIRYNDTEIPALILGDSAFRLTKDVMKPFPFHTENSPLQRSFNYRLSKCRRVVENAFGHLKARFRRLGKGIDNRVGNAKSVISAACVLHNFLITEKDVVQDSWIETYDGGNRVQPAFINVDSSRNEGEKIRNVICNYIEDITMNALKRFFADKLRIGASDSNSRDGTKIFEDLSLTGLSNHWKTKGFKNIITMVGAGISTSAGIPDFRSPGSGLYDNLQKYDLPNPTAIFELDYFQYNPQPFFALAKELYPGTFTPTPTHYFIRLLHEKGLLTRHYTQNIDTLERIAGIPEKKLVEAHGTFYTNHCLRCHKSYSMEWMKEQIFSDNVPTCDTCNGLVKPDIVFFGEGLPKRFYTLPEKDFKKCDLLIIMGTSLEVQPFASLIDRPNVNCARLLINRTMVKNDSSLFNMFGGFTRPLKFNHEENTRDVAFIGDCDDGVWALAEALGWKEELKNLIDTELTSLNKKNHPTKLTIDVGHEEETAPSTSRGSNTDNEQSEEIESKQPDENEAKNDEEKAVSVYSI